MSELDPVLGPPPPPSPSNDFEASAGATHPGPPPAPSYPDGGRDGYRGPAPFREMEKGEDYLAVRFRDPAFVATARAYAATLYALRGPLENVESALQLADRGAAYEPKEMPNSIDPGKAEHYRYLLRQRAWHAQDGDVPTPAQLLAEEHGFQRGRTAALDDARAHNARVVELEARAKILERLLKSAGLGLRSYQYGNGAPGLAEELADRIEQEIGSLTLKEPT